MAQNFLRIDSLLVLTTAKKFFLDELTDQDSRFYPNIINDNLVCSFKSGCRTKTFGNKAAVTLTNNIVSKISELIKLQVSKKPNKPEICFVIYMLQNIFIFGDRGEGSLYANIVNGTEVVVPDILKPIVRSLIYDIYGRDYVRFTQHINNMIDLPEDVALVNVRRIERILNSGDVSKYNEIKIADLFIVRNLELNINVPSIVQNLDSYTNNIIDNLYDFLVNKKIIIRNAGDDKKDKIAYHLSDYNTILCKYLNQDDPNIPYDYSMVPEDNMTRLFTEYTLDEIDKFVNINNGYCFTLEYITLMIISYRGNVSYNELILSPDVPELCKDLTRYYSGKRQEQYDDIIGSLQQYTEAEYIHLRKTIDKLPDIYLYIEEKNFAIDDCEKQIKELGDNEEEMDRVNDLENLIRNVTKRFNKKCSEAFKNSLSDESLTLLFNYLISGNFKKTLDAINVQMIMNYSSNTIFELIGLTGYTLFSDMITQGENVDGGEDMFSISTFCIGHLRDLQDKLDLIKSKGESLKNLLDNIRLGTQQMTLSSILKNAETQCIHGVGKTCLEYYLRAYEACLLYKPVIPQQGGDPEMIPEGLKADEDVIKKMFSLAPFLVRTTIEIERQTGFRYLTCLAHDRDRYSRDNPNNHYYIISGFTTDFKFSHLLTLKCDSFRQKSYEDDDNSVEYLFENNSQNYFIDIHNGSYQYRNEKLALMAYYSHCSKNNLGEIIKLLKIPYSFHRHRKTTYKIFKDYTLHNCYLMSAETNPGDKYKTLSDFAFTKKTYDIMGTEVPHLPKYLTIIDLRDPKKSKNMWNANSGYDNVNKEDGFNQSYYVDSIDNFLNLEYTTEINEAGDKYPVIKTPETRKDVSRSYRFCQLIGKIICNTNCERINVSLKDKFSYFNNYFLNVAGQVSEFRNGLFKNIAWHGYNKSNCSMELMKKDLNPLLRKILTTIQMIDAVNVIDIYKDLDTYPEESIVYDFKKTQIFSRVSIVYYLFSGFYAIAPPTISNHYNYIRPLLRFDSVEKHGINFYEHILGDILTIICREGNLLSSPRYHFTELDKEFYLLKHIQKLFRAAYIPQNGIVSPMNEQAIEVMIGILNKTFEYFQVDNDYKLNTKTENKLEYDQDSRPLAVEYINKIELLDIHASRMFVFWDFEKMLLKLVDNETYEEYVQEFYNITEIALQYLPNFNEDFQILNLNDMLKVLKHLHKLPPYNQNRQSVRKRAFISIFDILQTII